MCGQRVLRHATLAGTHQQTSAGPHAPSCPPPHHPTSLQGETDVCGATLSLDPEWTDRIDFIQPYFYSAGIALYTDPVG